MRTALILLALLALAAVPGSVLPQRGVASDPNAVLRFSRGNPVLARWLDRFGFFEVYSSPWFAAVYLLLLISMTGCVLPRCLRLWRASRADPPRVPSSLVHLPGHHRWQDHRSGRDVLSAAATELTRRGFRVRVEAGAVRAEKGYLREAGNLLFHLSLLILLFGVAAGALFGFEGRVIVAEGNGFSNTRSQYDEFTAGPLVDEERLTPFSFTLERFSASFEPVGPQRGTPREFRADVQVRTAAGRSPKPTTIEVNKPLTVNGTKVFLTGNGYAPEVTVRDGQGQAVFTGPIVFLPLDGNMTSEGVVKAPDAQPTQLAFEGLFTPTAATDARNGPYSTFPAPLDPMLFLTAYTGDLGMETGVPQSVFTLNKTGLKQVASEGKPFARALEVGETMTLPDGSGSITFDAVSRFANFQIARDPGKEISLVAAVLLLIGLTMSLTIGQRRIWVTVRPAPGTAVTVDVASLAMTRRDLPADEVAAIVAAVNHADNRTGQPEPVAASTTTDPIRDPISVTKEQQ